MKCSEYLEDRVLASCGENTGRGWSRHRETCPSCAAAVRDFAGVRRAYARTRPVRLNDRTRRSILASIRRERIQARLRSAVASIAGVAAAILILAGIGRMPPEASAAVAAPLGSTIDSGLAEVKSRLTELELESPAYFDSALEDLKARVGSLSWDAENL